MRRHWFALESARTVVVLRLKLTYHTLQPKFSEVKISKYGLTIPTHQAWYYLSCVVNNPRLVSSRPNCTLYFGKERKKSINDVLEILIEGISSSRQLHPPWNCTCFGWIKATCTTSDELQGSKPSMITSRPLRRGSIL